MVFDGELLVSMVSRIEAKDICLGIFFDLFIPLHLFHGDVWVTLMILSVMKKKKGNVPHPPWLIRDFCEALSDRQLQYLPLKGYLFTWERGRGSSHWVEERLDRALVNVSWLNLFSNAKLNNLVAPISDHSPIELITMDKFSCVYKHRFRFENGWLKKDGLDFVVSNAWRSSHVVSLINKIHTCSFALKEWGREHAFKFKNKISHYKRCIEQYRDKDGPMDSQVLKVYKTVLSNVLMQ